MPFTELLAPPLCSPLTKNDDHSICPVVSTDCVNRQKEAGQVIAFISNAEPPSLTG